MNDKRARLPTFTLETATQKVRLAEDAWNSRDPPRESRRLIRSRELSVCRANGHSL